MIYCKLFHIWMWTCGMRHLSFVLVSTHRFDMSRSMFRCESDMKGSEICAANIFICFVPMPESQMRRCPLCKFVLKYFSQQISGHDCKKLLCLCSFLFVSVRTTGLHFLHFSTVSGAVSVNSGQLKWKENWHWSTYISNHQHRVNEKQLSYIMNTN